MKNSVIRSGALALALASGIGFTALSVEQASAASSDQQDSSKFVKRGRLSCDVAAGIGLVIGSSKALDCSFAADNGKFSQTYSGTIRKLGLDVGVTGKGKVVWAVYAHPKTKLKGKLTGSYSGVSAEATAGVGLSAKALLGSQKEIALQPVKLGGQTGVNLAVGIASVKLSAGN